MCYGGGKLRSALSSSHLMLHFRALAVDVAVEKDRSGCIGGAGVCERASCMYMWYVVL